MMKNRRRNKQRKRILSKEEKRDVEGDFHRGRSGCG